MAATAVLPMPTPIQPFGEAKEAGWASPKVKAKLEEVKALLKTSAAAAVLSPKRSAPPAAADTFVFGFHEGEAVRRAFGPKWEDTVNALGGKGAGLLQMTSLSLPVPKGFTISTTACAYYLKHGALPPALDSQLTAAVAELERRSGKRFGSATVPLLVSVRSGARMSMPGMMDTVLNVGMNEATATALAASTSNGRWAFDSLRRLLQGFGTIVFGIDNAEFEAALKQLKLNANYTSDTALTEDDWKALVKTYRHIIRTAKRSHPITGDVPEEPLEQVRLCVSAVFDSWNNARAVAYRAKTGIPDWYGTAVNVQEMVFGNTGPDSATGVAFTRNPSTGANELFGEFLCNAQGEDVVSGIRNAQPIQEMGKIFPKATADFLKCCRTLEKHFRNMQDIEFTIEHGVLFMLQCRNAKRTAHAQCKVAVDMVAEGTITKAEAVQRVSTDDVTTLLLPRLDEADVARSARNLLVKGINASPGGAVGQVVFDEKAATSAKARGEKVILVRPFTRSEDVPAFFAAEGVLTAEGGATSHAAVVARQFGLPCIVGATALTFHEAKESEAKAKTAAADGKGNGHCASEGQVTVTCTLADGSTARLSEGDWISLDATRGAVYRGQLKRVPADFFKEKDLLTVLQWADELCAANGGLQVHANSDTGPDAERARAFGARGIGLCRTEHSFFDASQLPIVERMIMATDKEARAKALADLFPFQRKVFYDLFAAMRGLPVVIRTLDPPLHEFLPSLRKAEEKLFAARMAAESAGNAGHSAAVRDAERMVEGIERWHENNPMIGLRGCRVGILFPEIIQMQVRALFQAACDAAKAGLQPRPSVMIPLTTVVTELDRLKEIVTATALQVLHENGTVAVPWKYGTMIEAPRAALTADAMVKTAEFFSFGTNDLTQLTFGMARDDAERHFLMEYVTTGVLPANPFQTLDEAGVGALIDVATKAGRKARGVGMDIGICGEVGGDPTSIRFIHRTGLSYVSCAAFRVPVARLATAQAAIALPRPQFVDGRARASAVQN